MSAHRLLDQLLRSGQDLLGRKGAGGGLGGLGQLGGLGGLAGLGRMGGGAGAAGLLGSLLGSKRGRSYGGKALKYGSLAALGVMAYKAYEAWQAQQAQQGGGANGNTGRAGSTGNSASAGSSSHFGSTGTGTGTGTGSRGSGSGSSTGSSGFGSSGFGSGSRSESVGHWPGDAEVAASSFASVASGEPRTVDRVPPAEAEQHSRAVLLAMIAAAKADGHLDDRERELIEKEIAQLEDDPALRQWHQEQLRRPLDPAEVARAATTPEMAAEMYLASLMMVDESSYMERAYLDELARQLRLPEGLKAQLEAQALAGG